MPTPFYHLAIAVDLLENPDLPLKISGWLKEQRGPYLFGNTAPDVQVISGQPREATHFFRLPVESGDQPAWEACLRAYPGLSNPALLPPAQGAFLAGYLCHLLADWYWIRDIYSPVFGPSCIWATFSHRLYLHNVLRAHLDRQVLETLPGDIGVQLKEVKPAHWLPFTEDIHLGKWRDFISRQLQPGGIPETVEVFARRQGVSPEEFTNMLDSSEQMEAEVFTRIPHRKLATHRQQLEIESLTLLQSYLSGGMLGRARRFYPSKQPDLYRKQIHP